MKTLERAAFAIPDLGSVEEVRIAIEQALEIVQNLGPPLAWRLARISEAVAKFRSGHYGLAIGLAYRAQTDLAEIPPFERSLDDMIDLRALRRAVGSLSPTVH
jgi:hypothetical protein